MLQLHVSLFSGHDPPSSLLFPLISADRRAVLLSIGPGSGSGHIWATGRRSAHLDAELVFVLPAGGSVVTQRDAEPLSLSSAQKLA